MDKEIKRQQAPEMQSLQGVVETNSLWMASSTSQLHVGDDKCFCKTGEEYRATAT